MREYLLMVSRITVTIFCMLDIVLCFSLLISIGSTDYKDIAWLNYIAWPLLPFVLAFIEYNSKLKNK